MAHHMKTIHVHGKAGGHVKAEHAHHHPHYGHVHHKASDTVLGGGSVHAHTSHKAAFAVGYKQRGGDAKHGSGAGKAGA